MRGILGDHGDHSASALVDVPRGAVKVYGRGAPLACARVFAREGLLIPRVAASFARRRASTILFYRVYSLLAYCRRPAAVAATGPRFVKFNDAPRAAYRREGKK
jgi:hypothetical protein